VDDDLLPEGRTREEYQLDLLRDRLSQPRWNFSRGHNSFAGYSEGICLLGGIDPTESFSGSEGIGWQFLPGGLEYYGFQSFPTWDDAWQLDEVVKMTLDHLLALELKGLQVVGTAIRVADKFDMAPPWMKAANADFECAKRLPPRLRTNAEIIKQIRHRDSVKAAHSGAERRGKTPFLNNYVKPIFDQMMRDGFKAVHDVRDGRSPFDTEIAEEIYHEIRGHREPQRGASSDHRRLLDQARKYWAEHPEVLPQEKTIEVRVRAWRDGSGKTSQQKKQ
jgi:hypothetical protein